MDGAARPLPAVYALAYGAGVMVSAILSLVDADVDHRIRQVRARAQRRRRATGWRAWQIWVWPRVADDLATRILPPTVNRY